jgi:hypothetical protein
MDSSAAVPGGCATELSGTEVVPCHCFVPWAGCHVGVAHYGHGCGGLSALGLCGMGLASVVGAGVGCPCLGAVS